MLEKVMKTCVPHLYSRVSGGMHRPVENQLSLFSTRNLNVCDVVSNPLSVQSEVHVTPRELSRSRALPRWFKKSRQCFSFIYEHYVQYVNTMYRFTLCLTYTNWDTVGRMHPKFILLVFVFVYELLAWRKIGGDNYVIFRRTFGILSLSLG